MRVWIFTRAREKVFTKVVKSGILQLAMPCAIALLRHKAIAVFCSENRSAAEKLKKVGKR